MRQCPSALPRDTASPLPSASRSARSPTPSPSARASPPRSPSRPRRHRPPPPPWEPSQGSRCCSWPRSSAPRGSRCCGSSPTSTAPTASPPEDLRAKISLCDALIVKPEPKVSRNVFEASGGKLRVVGRAGVGIDNVDLAAATEHRCLVVNALTANTVAVAKHGIALLTVMARNIAQADASLKAEITVEYLFFNYLNLMMGRLTFISKKEYPAMDMDCELIF